MLNRHVRFVGEVGLTLLVCVGASLAGAWLVSRAFGFSFDASHTAALSGAIGGAAIALELHRARKSATCLAP